MRDRRKSSSALSSDGFDFDDDAEMEESENQDDDVLNDEVCANRLSVLVHLLRRNLLPIQLFRRIMASARHKQQHNFHLSYQLEVGSSIDPDMEDISRWERELQGLASITPLVVKLLPLIFG